MAVLSEEPCASFPQPIPLSAARSSLLTPLSASQRSHRRCRTPCSSSSRSPTMHHRPHPTRRPGPASHGRARPSPTASAAVRPPLLPTHPHGAQQLTQSSSTEAPRTAAGQAGLVTAVAGLLAQAVHARGGGAELLSAQTELARVVGNLCFEHGASVLAPHRLLRAPADPRSRTPPQTRTASSSSTPACPSRSLRCSVGRSRSCSRARRCPRKGSDDCRSTSSSSCARRPAHSSTRRSSLVRRAPPLFVPGELLHTTRSDG